MAVYDDQEKDQGNTLVKKSGFYKNAPQSEVDKKFNEITSDPELQDLKKSGFYKGDESKKSLGAEKEEPEKKALGKASDKGKLKGKAKKKSRNKIALAIIGAIGLPSLAIFLVLYGFLGFSVEHLARLQTAYRFGAAHRQMARVTRQIIISDLTISAGSRAAAPNELVGGRTSLINRLSGWSPEKAMTALGASDIQLTYDRVSVGGARIPGTSQLVSFEDLRTGTVYTANELGSGGLLSQLGEVTDARLSEQGKGRFFRRRTVNHLRTYSGIRLARFRAFIAARDSNQRLTAEEGKIALANEDLDRVKTGSTYDSRNPDVSNDATANEEAVRRTGDPTIESGPNQARGRRLSAAQLSRLNTVATVSNAMFLMTMYCIVNDIVGQVDQAIETQIGSVMRHAASLHTGSDMFRAGDATQEALRAEAKKWQGAERSQEYAMATGKSLNTVAQENQMPGADYPFKIFGLSVADVNSISNIVEGVLFPAEAAIRVATLGRYGAGDVCGLLMNPWVQAGTLIVDIVATIASIGGAQVAGKSVTTIVQQVLKGVVASASLGFIVYYIQSKMVDLNSGMNAVFGEGEGVKAYNTAGAGNTIINMGNNIPYAGEISATELARQQRESILELQEYERSKGTLYAYLSPHSPFSLTSSIAMSAPLGLQSVASTFKDFGSWLFNPGKSFNFAFAGVGAQETYDPELEFYGMQDYLYGLTDAQATGADPTYRFENLVADIESDMQRYIDEYGECLVQTVVDVALERTPGQCDDEDANKLKMYYLYCETIDAVARVGAAEDGYFTRDCFDLAGDYANEFQSSTPTSVSTNTTAATTLQAPQLNGYAIDCGGDPRAVVERSFKSADWSGIPDSGTIGTDSAGQPIKVYIREACDTRDPRTAVIVGSIHGSENGGQLVGHELLFNANIPNDVRIIVIPELCNCAGTGTRGNANGVDLNRNYNYDWGSLPQTQTFDSGQTYSKGTSAESEPETQAMVGFLNSIANEVDILFAYHDNLNYVASAVNTPVSYAQAYAASGAVPLRTTEGGRVSQRGSLDGWFNLQFSRNSLLVEMGDDSTQNTQNILNHVQGVLNALNN